MNVNKCEYEANYIAYSDGTVYSKRKYRLLKPHLNNCGYYQYMINGKWHKAHRIVAKCFIDNPNNCPEVNHIDSNKLNNDVSNLEWCTKSQNIKHSYTADRLPPYERKLIRVYKGRKLIDTCYVSKAIELTGCKASNISACCNNKITNTKGYVFKFA